MAGMAAASVGKGERPLGHRRCCGPSQAAGAGCETGSGTSFGVQARRLALLLPLRRVLGYCAGMAGVQVAPALLDGLAVPAAHSIRSLTEHQHAEQGHSQVGFGARHFPAVPTGNVRRSVK